MKKNVVPLVIIALVVAVAATGIFYGLIVSRMDAKAQAAPQLRLVANGNFEKGRVIEKGDLRLAEVVSAKGNEADTKNKNSLPLEKPEQVIGRSLLENLSDGQPFSDRILSPYRRRNLDGGIPAGMRAATIHVADSSSVVEMIEAGDRIDIQSVATHQAFGQSASVHVKTVLENVLVYGLGPRETSQQFGQRSILTLLVSPAEAEKLAYADAASRLRVTLRNRQDNSRLSASPAILQPSVTSKFQAKAAELPSSTGNQLFEVQLYEVPSQEFKNPDQLEISSGDWRKKIESLASSSQARLWASSRIESSRGGQLTWQGSDPAATVAVRVEALPLTAANQSDLRIQPSVALAGTGKESLRQISKQLSVQSTQSALVSGLVPREQWTSWREKFSPGGASSLGPDSGLVLLITPLSPTKVINPSQAINPTQVQRP